MRLGIEESGEFKPLTIVIESKKELDILFDMMVLNVTIPNLLVGDNDDIGEVMNDLRDILSTRRD